MSKARNIADSNLDDLTVDTDTLHIDSTNNRVGIGTSSPSHPLHVYNSSAGTVAEFRSNDGTNNPRFSIYGDSSGTHLHHTWSSGAAALIFEVGGSAGSNEKMRILNGGGITFNGDTAAANALDDYEEGTWTPAVIGGGAISLTSTNRKYTKIGNSVTITADINFDNAGDANTLQLGGLPFNVQSASLATFALMHSNVNVDSGFMSIIGYIFPTNTMRVYEVRDNGTWSPLRGNQVGSSTEWIFSATYLTA